MKWGYKLYVQSSISGFIHNFLLYGGEKTFANYNFTEFEDSSGFGAKVVVRLCHSIKSTEVSFVFFDNFFSSLELVRYL